MKNYFLGILVTFISFSGFSQNTLNFEFSVGPSFSLLKESEYSSINTDGIESKSSLGFYLQSNLNYRASELISLDFGVGYSLNRFAIEEKNSPVRDDIVRKTSDIYLPIGINFHLGKEKLFSIGTGLAVNFLLSAEEKGMLNLSLLGVQANNNPGASSDIKNDIKSIYSEVSLGVFLQAKKMFSLSESLGGFVLFKVNQNLGRFEEVEFRASADSQGFLRKEIEAAVVTVGFGIQL